MGKKVNVSVRGPSPAQFKDHVILKYAIRLSNGQSVEPKSVKKMYWMWMW